MSIWASWLTIGHDDHESAGGVVLTYASGFSNHYPDTTASHELPASVDLAHIPPWCVPGHGDHECDAHVGDWLRLSVHAPRAFDFWGPNGQRRNAGPVNADVVLDEAAARVLRDQLDEWLALPKLRESAHEAAMAATKGRQNGAERIEGDA